MKEKNTVGVIVPVYNAENYIDRCIKSILTQKHNNIRLYIVDDFSSDNSFAKCQEWAKKDSRICLYKNNKNLGVSTTRNVALKLLKDEDFFIFIDSDDYVDENLVTHLLEISVKYPEYIPMCSLAFFSDMLTLQSTQSEVVSTQSEIVVYDKRQYYCNEYGIHPWACATLFKTELAKIINLYFEEKAKFGEDAYFVAKYCVHFKGIALSKCRLYYYFMNPNGGALNKSRKKLTEKDVMHRYTVLYAYNDATQNIKKYNEGDLKYCEAGFCFLAANILLMIERTGFKNKEIINKLNKFLSFPRIVLYTRNCNTLLHILLVYGIFFNRRLTRLALDKLLFKGREE